MGAGGKFFINCLGISESACLQDWELYELTPKEKKTLIFDRLFEVSEGTWNDLDLGCFKMFENNLDGMTAEEIHSIDWEFQKIIDISSGDKYFFQTTHNEDDYIELCSAFPNAITVKFINSEQIKRNNYNPKDFAAQAEFTFDVADYNTLNSTLDKIQLFYNKFGMPDFDADFISEYYTLWKDKI